MQGGFLEVVFDLHFALLSILLQVLKLFPEHCVSPERVCFRLFCIHFVLEEFLSVSLHLIMDFGEHLLLRLPRHCFFVLISHLGLRLVADCLLDFGLSFLAVHFLLDSFETHMTAVLFSHWNVLTDLPLLLLLVFLLLVLCLCCFFEVLLNLAVVILMDHLNHCVLVGPLRLPIFEAILLDFFGYFGSDVRVPKVLSVWKMPPFWQSLVVLHGLFEELLFLVLLLLVVLVYFFERPFLDQLSLLQYPRVFSNQFRNTEDSGPF